MSSSPIQLKSSGAEIYIPDGRPILEALGGVTHLGIAAHPDDLEIMAAQGILDCFDRKDKGFAGVVLTDGAREGAKPLAEIRKVEQKKAAVMGKYRAQFFLNHSSSGVKTGGAGLLEDLTAILARCRPQVVYTHNLADKHDTHVAAASRVIEALRGLPESARPAKVIGCEVWRDLDWLCDGDKVVMPVDDEGKLTGPLLRVFESQIKVGKRYDLAVQGRRLAHATFHESHGPDRHKSLIWGMDLIPLVEDPSLDYFDYVKSYIDRFADEVKDRLRRMNHG